MGELGIADLPNKLPIKDRPKTNYPYWLKTMNSHQFNEIRKAYLKRLTRNVSGRYRYLIDTIPGNFMYLGLFGICFQRLNFSTVDEILWMRVC